MYQKSYPHKNTLLEQSKHIVGYQPLCQFINGCRGEEGLGRLGIINTFSQRSIKSHRKRQAVTGESLYTFLCEEETLNLKLYFNLNSFTYVSQKKNFQQRRLIRTYLKNCPQCFFSYFCFVLGLTRVSEKHPLTVFLSYSVSVFRGQSNTIKNSMLKEMKYKHSYLP